MPEELLRGLRVADMGAHRDGEEGAPALPWKKCTITTFQFATSHRKGKNVATRQVSRAPNIPKLRLWPGRLCPGPRLVSLHHSPDLVAGFKGTASQRKRKGRVGMAGGKRRGRREREKNGGMDRKGRA